MNKHDLYHVCDVCKVVCLAFSRSDIDGCLFFSKTVSELLSIPDGYSQILPCPTMMLGNTRYMIQFLVSPKTVP